MKNLEFFLAKQNVLQKTAPAIIPRKYYRRLHEFMEDWVYGTLGRWRGYKYFSFDRVTLAAFVVVLVSAVQLVFFLTLDFKVTYLLYLVGVFLAAWLGGTRTAIVTMCLSVVVIAILFKPTFLYIFVQKAELFELGMFVFGCLFITFLVTSVAQARRYRDFVTEQLKSKERHLINVNTYIQSLLESINDGFIACDHNFMITYANSAMLKLIKKKHARMVGQKIDVVFPKHFVEIFHANYTKYMHSKIGQPIFRFDWQFGDRWFLVNIYPKDGTISIYFDDITLHKEREQRKDFFIRAASHELKTPITSMKLFVEIVQSSFKDEIPPEAGTYLAKVQSQLNKMTILINSLLDLSRIEGGEGIVLERKNLDLGVLVHEAIEMFRFLSSAHKIEVEIDLKEKVYADKERVTQVIVNLISNAIKYSPAGGVVKVRVKSLIGMVEVCVADSGIGIDKQYHNKIFKRFFRIDEKDRQVYPGLGVGLYISYGIIKNHNGHMWVESERGKGSAFYFTLPYARLEQGPHILDRAQAKI